MEKIFSYNVDIDKTAYMNWRTRQHQPIHDMMIIADGYMKAAIMLAQDCLQDNGDKKGGYCSFPNAVFGKPCNRVVSKIYKLVFGYVAEHERVILWRSRYQANMEHSKETYDRF